MQIPGYILLQLGWWVTFMGSNISFTTTDFHPYLMKKSQQFKVQEGQTHTPGEIVTLPLSCIRRHRGEVTLTLEWETTRRSVSHLSILPDELSHVLEGALALAHPEDWDFCTSAADFIRISNHEKAATCNLTTTTGSVRPRSIEAFQKTDDLGFRKYLLVPFALRIMGFGGAQFYIYLHILYILPFKTNYTCH